MSKADVIWPFAALIVFFAIGSACDDVSNDRSARKLPKERLLFVESSGGLPKNGKWRQKIDIYDLDKDGHLDVLSAPPRLPLNSEDRKPCVWYGDGAGQWARGELDVPKDMPFSYGTIRAGDYDSDGKVDFALAMHNLGLMAFQGDGQGGYFDFSTGLPPKEEFTSRTLSSGDFDNDGRLDLVSVAELSPKKRGISAAVDSFLWFCRRSDARWRCKSIGSDDVSGRGGLFADDLATGDVNGDGYLDIGVASLNHEQNLIVWIGDGKFNFTPFNKGLTRGVHYNSVAFADVDRDGRDDLIASVSGFGSKGIRALKVFLSEKDGFHEMSSGLPDNTIFVALAACDLDKDGRVEIVGGTGEGGVRVFSEKGGRWQEMEKTGLPLNGMQRIYGIYCRDLNNDGLRDIVANYSLGRETNEGGIRVFLAVPKKQQ